MLPLSGPLLYFLPATEPMPSFEPPNEMICMALQNPSASEDLDGSTMLHILDTGGQVSVDTWHWTRFPTWWTQEHPLYMYKNDPNLYLPTMIAEWLRRTDPKSMWATLVSSLRQCTVNEEGLQMKSPKSTRIPHKIITNDGSIFISLLSTPTCRDCRVHSIMECWSQWTGEAVTSGLNSNVWSQNHVRLSPFCSNSCTPSSFPFS